MKYQLQAKKSLGQNFLKNKKIIEKIVDEAKNFVDKDTVLMEIGGGTGELTSEILKIFPNNKTLCIEADDRAIDILNERFKTEIKNKQLEIIHQDIRKYTHNPKFKNYVLIANIPYYLTGFIFKLFLESEHQPKAMILMVQKEIAKRAIDKKMNLFSLGIKTYGQPYILTNVSKGNFTPMPKVDSAVLVIKDINKNIFKDNVQEKTYWTVVKKAFSSKRKKVSSNLRGLKLHSENEQIKKMMNQRPEDLNPNDWIYIINLL